MMGYSGGGGGGGGSGGGGGGAGGGGGGYGGSGGTTGGGTGGAGGFGRSQKDDGLKVNSITDRSGTSGPVIAGVSTNASSGCMIIPKGPTEHRGGRGRGIVAGGRDNPNTGAVRESIDMHEIATAGNAVDFGDLAQENTGTSGGASSATRAVLAGGYEYPADSLTDRLQFVILSSQGGANNFGNLIEGNNNALGCTSNNTRGLFYGGNNPARLSTLSQINLQSLGENTSFGNTFNSVPTRNVAGLSNGTRAVFAGGDDDNSNLFTIAFVLIASGGSPDKFGDLTDDLSGHGSVSSAVRGCFGGGKSPSVVDTIDFITIATEGNATDFGNLTVARRNVTGNSNSVRGTFSAGTTTASGSGNNVNTIDFITIASTGNAQDFGDLTLPRRANNVGGSDAHGGLTR